MDYTLEDIRLFDIDVITPLWKSLNAIHIEESTHFKAHFRSVTFDKRIAPIREVDDSQVKITLVRDSNGDPAGYCISTAKNGEGELESLYLDPSFRGLGAGEKLVKLHVEWMMSKRCRRIRVSVAEGHESVIGFYEKMGFSPRLTVLEFRD